MKIYFSGSIRGGRDHQVWYAHIVAELQKYGEVLSRFIADKDLTSYGSKNMTDEEIYTRDISLIEESDVIVADITTPSLGVGYEIAYAENIHKKIFCLYQNIENKKPSAMITGNMHCVVFSYTSEEDISLIIKNIFNK